MNNDRLVFITAGEKSGDSHAAGLVHELGHFGSQFNIKFVGIGGDSMKHEGVKLLYHINQLTTSGITGVIKKYKYFRNVLKDCLEFVKNNKPDIIILTDFPGFNLKFAEELREFYKGKIIYYISPQVWAWHKSRVYKVKKYVDKMLVVFPFEKEFYKKYDVDAEYVGHPLVKKIKKFLVESTHFPVALQRGEKRVITILPGSRNEEIVNHLAVLVATAKKLQDEFNAEIYFHESASVDKRLFDKYREKFNIVNNDVYKLILNSDLVLTKAGTSTVECALIGTPIIICYRTNPINYHLIKPMVNIKNMGMVNILAGKTFIREFIQNDFSAEKLTEEARRILNDTEYNEQMRVNMKKIWDILGEDNASENAARIILSYL